MTVVAALQLGTGVPLERILAFEDQLRDVSLVVLPEAVLGGYPGRVPFVEYFHAAVAVPGPETAALAGLASRTGATLVAGVIERAGSALYSTVVFLDPELGLVGKHRKLVPTARERVFWGRGDGSTLPVVPTAAGRRVDAPHRRRGPVFRGFGVPVRGGRRGPLPRRPRDGVTFLR